MLAHIALHIGFFSTHIIFNYLTGYTRNKTFVMVQWTFAIVLGVPNTAVELTPIGMNDPSVWFCFFRAGGH